MWQILVRIMIWDSTVNLKAPIFFTHAFLCGYSNPAAFLTRSYSSNFLGKIEDVISEKKKICAHPALEDELSLAHPEARFVFNREGKELYGLVEDYQAGKCDFLAVGKMDSLGDLKLMDLFCKENLVYTESLVIENVSILTGSQ